MEHFETILKSATARGANNVPGAVVAVVDKEGHFLYKYVAGFDGVADDAKPTDFDQTYFVASCTKLITSIAALQAVERGLVALDDPLDKQLPELISQPIIEVNGDSDFSLCQATRSITLRHLLTHSSGAVYDLFSPALDAWRQSRGERPGFSTDMIVAKDYAIPRCFEAGDYWTYGTGPDWAGLLVARLNHTSFEEYIEENIAKPLGITTFTWHLSRKPHVANKLMRMVERTEGGKLVERPTPLWPEPVEEGGGAGLYTNAHDYTRVLADLLRDAPTLLRKETVELLFTPQFSEDSPALKGLYENNDTSWKPMIGGSVNGVVVNHGLGGLVVLEDVQREDYLKPKGTLTWTGMPNLLWSVNREKGLALFFATQVIPYGDAEISKLWWAFETGVWRDLVK